MSSSITSRKRDLAYVFYCGLQLVCMFAVDLQSLYPPSLIPSTLISVKVFHVTQNHDLFMIQPPPFFIFMMWMEVFFQVPVCLWLIPALWRNDHRTPAVVLIYGVQTFVTTAICCWEVLQWDWEGVIPKGTELLGDIGSNGKMAWEDLEMGGTAGMLQLLGIYAPYLVIPLYMIVDSYGRINAALGARAVGTTKKNN